MTIEIDALMFAFNMALLVVGVVAGILLGWALYGLRIEKKEALENQKEDERRREADFVATDAWLWACEKFPENRDARSAACEGYNAGANRQKPKETT